MVWIFKFRLLRMETSRKANPLGFHLTLQNWIFLGRLARGQLQDLRDEVLAAKLPQVGFLIGLGKMEEVLGLIVLQAALIQEEFGDLLRA